MGFFGADYESLKRVDPDIAQVLTKEVYRLRDGLQLIASENLTSPAVLTALGSTLSNKYAEGYPDRRYYGGCEVVDEAEKLAIERAKLLFSADHANVQPHSGANANIAAYGAFVAPGDTVLAMSLPHGGHLTHGTAVSFSGQWFNFVHYGVSKETEDIDYQQVEELAKQHKPKLIVAGGSAIPRNIDFEFFRKLCDDVGAIFMVDAAHIIGLVAGKAISSPVPYADVVTFTTHKVLRGPRGGMILCKEEHAKAIDKAVFPMMQGGPLMHCIAAKAVALKEASSNVFQDYAKQVIKNAQALVDELTKVGFRAVSGGTDSHLALLDLQSLEVSGKDAEDLCSQSGIVINKNAIPYDPAPPSVASGIRIGTPSVTTQGMTTKEMPTIASIMHRAITQKETPAKLKSEVHELLKGFPAYPMP